MAQTPEEKRAKNAERAKKWRETHPDYMKQYMQTYREVNGDEMRANDRRYHAEHREEKNRARREWAKANPEKDKAATDAWRAANLERVKEGYLRRLYGISLAEYQALLDKQGGSCGICKGPPMGRSNGVYYHVDHDHQTGEVRGLLCSNCNTALGLFRDDVELLQKAIAYLTRPTT